MKDQVVMKMVGVKGLRGVSVRAFVDGELVNGVSLDEGDVCEVPAADARYLVGLGAVELFDGKKKESKAAKTATKTAEKVEVSSAVIPSGADKPAESEQASDLLGQ